MTQSTAKRNKLINTMMKEPALNNNTKKKQYIKSLFKAIDTSNLPAGAEAMLEMKVVQTLLAYIDQYKKPTSMFEFERFIKEKIIDEILQGHLNNLKHSGDEGALEFVNRVEEDPILTKIQRAKIAEQFSDIFVGSVETYSDEFWAQDKYICSICQTAVESQKSHNPEPLNSGRCCESCNEAVVDYRVGKMMASMAAQQQQEGATIH